MPETAYPLSLFDERKSAFRIEAGEKYIDGSGRARASGKGKLLSPIIDSLLLTGRLTMTGIVREIRRKAGAASRGKDLNANVRARLYWLKRRGYRIDKRDGRLTVIAS